MKINCYRQLFCLLMLSFFTHCAYATGSALYNWNGFYVGTTGGGVMTQFNAQTSTQSGPLLDSPQANAVNNAGRQVIDTSGFISGITAGTNWQRGRYILGLELDVQSLSTDGEKNTGAIVYPNRPDRQFVLTSYASNNWLFTARPRLGLTANNWLFYLTGGLALGFIQNDFVFSTNAGEFNSKRLNQAKSGYDVGAGIETALTSRTSLKAEYLFVDFSKMTPTEMNHTMPEGQTFSNSIKLKSNIVRLGVNYHFDNAASLETQSFPNIFNTSLWETEIGTRLFFSTGLNGSPQPLLDYEGMPLISRLTFSNLKAISGEVFARLDHAKGLFVKGSFGAGTVMNGHLNDEDFPAGGAYSNTLSHVRGNLSYVTADVGYSFLKTPLAKAGIFLGYNYFAQNLNVYDCIQQAGALVCVPSSELDKFLGISEDDYYNSFRIGLTNQFHLNKRFTLTSEAAYLPAVGYKGTDIHDARQLIGPERSNDGNGAMLESVLNYQLNESWRVGLGGRYWMWNMPKGTVTFDFLGDSGTIKEPARFNTQRSGVFLQLSYHEDKGASFEYLNDDVNWKGIFIGGHLGGGWGKSNWSDPFGSTQALGSLINVAGFGDEILSTGPLGGIDFNLNWQNRRLVYGAGASISMVDIRGENTLFSGLGGVNGQTIAKYLGSIFGKVGITSNSALFYLKGGRAVLNTKYNINANTGVLSLGTEHKTATTWGWTGGVGIEYAFNKHWSSNVEYDYVNIPSHHISLSELFSGSQISANQRLNIFRLGLNYKV